MGDGVGLVFTGPDPPNIESSCERASFGFGSFSPLGFPLLVLEFCVVDGEGF
jgi:hypothetical protein